MKRLLLSAAAVLSLLVASGCKNSCLQLAEKICDCKSTSTLRSNCKTAASEEDKRVTVSSTDDQRCSALMDQCDCHALDTAEGKLKCGLARDPADSTLQ